MVKPKSSNEPQDQLTEAESRLAHEKNHLSSFDKAISQAIGADRKLGRPDDPAITAYPTLWKWMTSIYIGRDHIKQPATLTIKLGPEGALATLTDRDLCCSFDASTDFLVNALQAIEDALNSPNPPMRSWGKKEPTLRKRKQGG